MRSRKKCPASPGWNPFGESVTSAGKKEASANPDWEAELAAYDTARENEEREYRSHHLVIPESGSGDLTDEENEVFLGVLRGLSADEIAEMHGVEVSIVIGLVEIVRAKLALDR